jgi:hypothetical protein
MQCGLLDLILGQEKSMCGKLNENKKCSLVNYIVPQISRSYAIMVTLLCNSILHLEVVRQ